ncbi:hypothetical protein Tco_0642321 [Tanacetum coccineum]
MYDKGNLHANVVQLREELDKVQTDLDKDPSNLSLREKEAATVVAFNEVLLMEEKFLKQKAKITWSREGDSNTAYFHKVVKSRVSRSRIDVVTDANGTVYHNNDVAKAFINHYEVFLGQPGNTSDFNTDNLFSTRLNDSEALNMVRDISSRGSLIGYDTPGVWCVFTNEDCSKLANIANPKGLLRECWYPNQSAFVPVECISTIVLLTKRSMHNYHLDRGVPRCAFKVDIQKAYDTVDWNFLRVILIGFGFHERMIGWIMECVTTTSFSISINGLLHGYFKGKRGLRQGDPLSPYLFTLIMEVFTLILHRRVQEASNFTYHRFCSELDLINLCFADDLFLFVHGDVNSAKVIKEALDEFKDRPGKYLGVPLVSSRLIFRDCKELIDKVQNRAIVLRLMLLTLVRHDLSKSCVVSFGVKVACVGVKLKLHGMLNLNGEGIHVYKLNNRSFWDIPYRGTMSWSWRKLLLLWPLIREFIWSCIGDGKMTSIWFDKWCVASPLSNIISSRDIARVGFTHASKVRDCIQDGLWKWPNDWLVKYPLLNSFPGVGARVQKFAGSRPGAGPLLLHLSSWHLMPNAKMEGLL